MSELEWIDIFSNNLKDIINEANMTEAELACEIGVDRSTINNYIHKKRIPTIKSVINISYALDCDIKDLIDFGEPIE